MSLPFFKNTNFVNISLLDTYIIYGLSRLYEENIFKVFFFFLSIILALAMSYIFVLVTLWGYFNLNIT